jgi:hypothetical protein
MWDPKQVFDAAIRLSRAPYTDGIYWHWATPDTNAYAGLDEAERRKRRLEELSYNPIAHPMQPPGVIGAIWTTGGLAIHIHRARPHWIETPWGEWPCWDMPGSGVDRFGPVDTLERLRHTLDINKGKGQHGGIWAVRSVGEVKLPLYEHGYSQQPRRLEEWAELCLAHDPPVPVSEHARWLLSRQTV